MSLLLPTVIAVLLLGGMGVAIIGSIKVPLAQRLQIDEARVGGLISLFGFTLIPVILTAGFLTDTIGRKPVLLGGGVLFALSLVLLSGARRYGMALACVVLLSGGWALVTNVSNVLVHPAFGGAAAYATNLANVFFGLGALLTPLVVNALVSSLGLGRSLVVLGGLALVPAALALGVDFSASAPVATAAATGTEDALSALLSDPMIWLLGFALFFYGPLEASMAGWTTTYLGEKGVDQKTASLLLSGFWLAFLLGRLVTAFSLPERYEGPLVFGLAVATTAVMAALALSRDKPLAILGVIAAGLVLGPVFPTVMAILLQHFPATSHGRAVGVFFAVGGIGWSVIPILIGAYAKRTSVQRGFVVAVGTALGLSIIAGLLSMRLAG